MLYLGISNRTELTHGVLSFFHIPSPPLFDAKYLFSAAYAELSQDFISSLSQNTPATESAVHYYSQVQC